MADSTSCGPNGRDLSADIASDLPGDAQLPYIQAAQSIYDDLGTTDLFGCYAQVLQNGTERLLLFFNADTSVSHGIFINDVVALGMVATPVFPEYLDRIRDWFKRGLIKEVSKRLPEHSNRNMVLVVYRDSTCGLLLRLPSPILGDSPRSVIDLNSPQTDFLVKEAASIDATIISPSVEGTTTRLDLWNGGRLLAKLRMTGGEVTRDNDPPIPLTPGPCPIGAWMTLSAQLVPG